MHVVNYWEKNAKFELVQEAADPGARTIQFLEGRIFFALLLLFFFMSRIFFLIPSFNSSCIILLFILRLRYYHIWACVTGPKVISFLWVSSEAKLKKHTSFWERDNLVLDVYVFASPAERSSISSFKYLPALCFPSCRR